MRRHPRRNTQAFCDGVSAFESRQNAFRPGQLHYRFENMRIIRGDIFSAAGIMKSRVFGTNRSIIEPSGDLVR